MMNLMTLRQEPEGYMGGRDASTDDHDCFGGRRPAIEPGFEHMLNAIDVPRRPVGPVWMFARSDREYHVSRLQSVAAGKRHYRLIAADRATHGSIPDVQAGKLVGLLHLIAVGVEEFE